MRLKSCWWLYLILEGKWPGLMEYGNLRGAGLKTPSKQRSSMQHFLFLYENTVLSPLVPNYRNSTHVLKDGQLNSIQLDEMVSLSKRLI